jgi:hypothetical protein
MNNNQQDLSICIPRVSSSTDKRYIKTVFEKIIGTHCNIKVIFVDIKNDERFKRVFVNIIYNSLSSNNSSSNNSVNNKINNLCDRLKNGQQLKIVYSDPLFWRCSLSNTKPHYK